MSKAANIIQLYPIVPMSRMGFPDEMLRKYVILEPAYSSIGGREVVNREEPQNVVTGIGFRQFIVTGAAGEVLGRFTQPGAGQAFIAACRFAESLGSPWKVRDGHLSFDPNSGRCWSRHLLGVVPDSSPDIED